MRHFANHGAIHWRGLWPFLRFNALNLVVYFHKVSLVSPPPPQPAPSWAPPWNRPLPCVWPAVLWQWRWRLALMQCSFGQIFLRKCCRGWVVAYLKQLYLYLKVKCVESWRKLGIWGSLYEGGFCTVGTVHKHGSMSWQLTGRKTLIVLCIFLCISKLFQGY